MIQYRGCGLDNVFLRNGYKHGRTEAGVETLHIENIDELHRAIAVWVCDLPRPLTPSEFKFLRKELDLSQKQLGSFLHVKEGTVSTWERDTFPIDALADRSIRTLIKERISGNPAFEEVLKKMAAQDCAERWDAHDAIYFEEHSQQWRQAA